MELAKDMTPIPGPILFMAYRQIRKKMAIGMTQDRILLKSLLS
jgi:hypothetical protein